MDSRVDLFRLKVQFFTAYKLYLEISSETLFNKRYKNLGQLFTPG